MQRTFSVVVERDEDGWYVGSVPELPGCHSQARTRAELKRRIREAIQAYLETPGQRRPQVEFVGVEKVRVSN